MAITKHEFHKDGASGKVDRKSIEYDAVFRIYSDDALDGPKTVLDYLYTNRPTTPWIGLPYKYGNDLGMLTFVDSISVPKRVTGSDTTTNIFEVTVSYKTRDSSDDQNGGGQDIDGNKTDNPIDFRPEITFGYANYQEACQLAIYRGGFLHDPPKLFEGFVMMPCNSSLTPLDEPLERDQSRRVWRIKTNHLYFHDEDAQSYIDTVNSVAYTIDPRINATGVIAARQGKIMSIEATHKTATVDGSTFDYYEVTVEIHIIPSTGTFPVADEASANIAMRDGWRDVVIDRSLEVLACAGDPDGKGGTISFTDILEGMKDTRTITDLDGTVPFHSVLLNGKGGAKDVCTDKKVYTSTWQKYVEKQWNSFYIYQALLVYVE